MNRLQNNTFNHLKASILQGTDIHTVAGEVVSILSSSSNSDATVRVELLNWMMNTCKIPPTEGNDNNVLHLRSTLLKLLPLVVTMDEQEFVLRHLQELISETKDHRDVLIPLSLQVIQDLSEYFQGISVLQFLSWLICQPSVEINGFEMMLSQLEQVQDIQEVTNGLHALRSSYSWVHRNLGQSVPLTLASFTQSHIRSAYLSLMDQVPSKDYTSFDALMLLATFHSHKDSRGGISNILYRDCCMKQEDESVNGSLIFSVMICSLKTMKVTQFSSVHSSLLVTASMDLAVYLLLSPIYYPNYPPIELIEIRDRLPIQRLLEGTKKFILNLFHLLSEKERNQMIWKILSMTNCNSGITEAKKSAKSRYDRDELWNRLPRKIQAMIKGENSHGSEKQVQFRHWHDVRTTSFIVLIELIREFRFEIGMSCIRHRLEEMAARRWYSNSGDACNATHFTDRDFSSEIIEWHCKAYVEYLHISTRESSVMVSDALQFVKTLLLSFWDLDVIKRSTMVDRDSSLIVAMILSRYLIQMEEISNDDRNMMIEFITRILLSRNGATESHIDAVTGYWGLVFLCSLCPDSEPCYLLQIQNEKYLIEFDHQHRKRVTLSQIEVFDRIKVLIIMRLGLIQSENDFMPVKNKSFVAYSTVPKFFEPSHSVKDPKIFCFYSLVRRIQKGIVLSSREIQEWFMFIQYLTYAYLQIGSSLACKWDPQRWILSSTELCLCTGIEETQISPNYRLSVGKGSCDAFNLDDFQNVPINVLLQAAYTHVFAIAANRALLIHSFDCSHSNGADSVSRSTVNMFQYQLAKIYDLTFRFRHIAESILEISDDHGICAQIEDLVVYVSDLFDKPSFIPLKVIMLSLCFMNNPSNMEKFDKIMRNISSNQPRDCVSLHGELEFLLQYLTLECSLLLNLMIMAMCRKSIEEQINAGINKPSLFSPLHEFLPCNEIMLLFLTIRTKAVWLPICRMYYASDNFLAGLSTLDDPSIVQYIADHARLSIALTLDITQHYILYISEDKKISISNELFTLSNNHCVEKEYDNQSQSLLIFEMMKCSMICQDSVVSSHILDFVFILTDGDTMMQDCFHKVTWHYLLQNGASETFAAHDAHLLFCLQRPFMKCIESMVELNGSINSAANRCFNSLIQILKKCFDRNNGYAPLYFSLLTHWSHTIYSSKMIDLFADLHFLLNIVEIIFSDMDYLKCSSTLGSSKESTNCIGVTAIEGLNKHTVSSFFDLLIIITVATLHISHTLPPRMVCADKMVMNDNMVEAFVKVIEVFGKLIDLYGLKYGYFPKASFQTVVNASQLCIKLCEDATKHTASIRKSETFPRRRRSSLCPLQILINGIREHCYKPVATLCEKLLDQNDSRREYVVMSLHTRSNKMNDTLLMLESLNNMKPSSLMVLPSNGESNWNRIVDQKIPMVKIAQGKKEKINSNVIVHANDPPCHSSDEDTFEAKGNWGMFHEN